MNRIVTLLAAWLVVGAAAVFAADAPGGPAVVEARDVPNDAGGSITVNWPASPLETGKDFKAYEVHRKGPKDTAFAKVGETAPAELTFKDEGLKSGVEYKYVVYAVANGQAPAELGAAAATPRGQWYNTDKTNVLVGVVFVLGIIGFFILSAKRGAKLFVRKIAGLEAVDEAIGRATEMGKPILFVSGLSDASDISTIAAMTILAKVAKKTAEYETPLIVPCYDPIVMMVEKEMVREAYTEAGKPDAFDEDSVFFITQSQFGYVAAVDGIMVREKPATNFYMGAFFAESLLLAETGAATGAIQIAGTDRVTQLPFFITACDYTLMGEELYAATAYLSRDPLFLGSLKGQDWSKAAIIACLLIGTIMLIISVDAGTWIATLFKTAAEGAG